MQYSSSEEETPEIIRYTSEEEWAEIEATCTDMGITVEMFALAVAYFCVEPGAKEALTRWYSETTR